MKSTFPRLSSGRTLLVFCSNVLFISILIHPNSASIFIKAANANSNGNIFRKKTMIPQIMETVVSTFPGCEQVYVKMKEEVPRFGEFLFPQLNRDSAGAYQVEYPANVTFRKDTDIHRYTKTYCALAIFSFGQEFSPELEKWMRDTLMPRDDPLLRKDEDYYIFITNAHERLADEILMTPTFGAKIKYKIALFLWNNGRGHVGCKTVDFYGGPGGAPQLKTITVPYKDGAKVDELFPDMAFQFNQKVLRVAVPRIPFRLEIRKGADGQYHPVRGFYKWYFDEALKKFNFSYHMFYASFGGGTGKQLQNGTWVGALGDVLYGKADIAPLVGLVYGRHKYIGWSKVLSYEWVLFATRSPQKEFSPKAIFWAFTPEMWLLFWLSLMVTSVALKIVECVSAYYGRAKRWNFSWNIFSALWYIYSTLLEQDKKIGQMRASSIRTLVIFWLFFAMVTTTVYRGKLVSLMAFPVDAWVPMTFAELANSDYKVALNTVGKAGAAHAWISSSTSPVMQKLSPRLDLIPEGDKCMARVLEERLGCIITKGSLDYVLVKNLTDRNGHAPITESYDTGMFVKDGWNFEKRAVFGHIFDRTLQAVVQMGVAAKWFQMDQDFVRQERNEWLRRSNQSKISFTQDDDPKPMILSQFIGVFLIGAVGIFVALFGFMVEFSFLSNWTPCQGLLHVEE